MTDTRPGGTQIDRGDTVTNKKTFVRGLICNVPGKQLVDILSQNKRESVRRTAGFVSKDSVYCIEHAELVDLIWQTTEESQEPNPRDRLLMEMMLQGLALVQQGRGDPSQSAVEPTSVATPPEPPPSDRSDS